MESKVGSAAVLAVHLLLTHAAAQTEVSDGQWDDAYRAVQESMTPRKRAHDHVKISSKDAQAELSSASLMFKKDNTMLLLWLLAFFSLILLVAIIAVCMCLCQQN